MGARTWKTLSLTSFSNLTERSISCCKVSTFSDAKFEEWLTRCSFLPRKIARVLTELSLSGCNIRDRDVVSSLSLLPQLHILDLSSNSALARLTSDPANDVMLSNLSALNFSNCQMIQEHELELILSKSKRNPHVDDRELPTVERPLDSSHWTRIRRRGDHYQSNEAPPGRRKKVISCFRDTRRYYLLLVLYQWVSECHTHSIFYSFRCLKFENLCALILLEQMRRQLRRNSR